MEEQTYFVRVRTRKYGYCVYEMDNLSYDAAYNKVREYYNDTYKVELWDNSIEDWISPEKFLEYYY